MIYLVLGLSIFVALILHETSHAVVMRRFGVEIEEFGLGFPVRILPQFSLKLKNLPRFRFSLLLLGAYVKPSIEGGRKIGGLDYNKQMLIYGAGVLTNFVCFGLSFPLGIILTGGGENNWLDYLAALGVVLGVALLWFKRELFVSYFGQIIGVIVLILFITPVLSS